MASASAPDRSAPRPIQIDPQGRVVLPTEVIQALGIQREHGDHIVFHSDKDGVKLLRARPMVEKPGGSS